MALVLDATVAGTHANSWATVAEFRAWADGRPNVDLSGAADDDCALALVGGTMRLEQETYAGARSTLGQALSFPRWGLERDGMPISGDVIPPAAKFALCEEAAALLVDPTRLERSGLALFDQVAVGPISVTLHAGSTDPDLLTPGAERWLAEFRLTPGGSFAFLRAS